MKLYSQRKKPLLILLSSKQTLFLIFFPFTIQINLLVIFMNENDGGGDGDDHAHSLHDCAHANVQGHHDYDFHNYVHDDGGRKNCGHDYGYDYDFRSYVNENGYQKPHGCELDHYKNVLPAFESHTIFFHCSILHF